MSTVVLAARNGDARAFATLVQQWQGSVCAIGLGILQDVQASEEVAQEVFLAAWQGLGTLRNPDSFGPWVRQMTRHKALSWRRSRDRRHDRVVPLGPAMETAGVQTDDLLAEEERRVVQEALDALPDDARDVMVLFYREGRSVRQVAELLELSEAAVKKRLSRARKAVRADVLERFGGVLQRTAPGSAFTAVVVAQLLPAPAAASVAVSTAGVAKGGAIASAGIVGVLLGYQLAIHLLPAERAPLLRRARNLTAGGLLAAFATVLLWPSGALFAVAGLVVLLGFVQVRLLPRAFAPVTDGAPDADQLRAARLGTVMGAIGWGLGAVCGLAGAWWGTLS